MNNKLNEIKDIWGNSCFFNNDINNCVFFKVIEDNTYFIYLLNNGEGNPDLIQIDENVYNSKINAFNFINGEVNKLKDFFKILISDSSYHKEGLITLEDYFKFQEEMSK